MTTIPKLEYVSTLKLRHNEDCHLLGVVATPDLVIYVEETYSPDAWMAQHALGLNGDYLESVDEVYGRNDDIQPLAVPLGAARPQPGWGSRSLNYVGPRHRGLRELERVDELVQPLTVQEKITLANHFNLSIAPPLLLGLAESYVLSEIQLVRPNVYIVCRRLRLAYVFAQVQLDDQEHPYDYDTLVLYITHIHERKDNGDISVMEITRGLLGAHLNRPMDCLMYDNHIFVADGGSADTPSAIHIWKVIMPTISDSNKQS